MTWTKFAFWLIGSYAAYYAAMILWDFIRGGRSPDTQNSQELTFAEHVEPLRQEPDENHDYSPSAMMASGGRNLKQIFSLAREEAIEFTRAVSF
jgi:hypothetical protein